MGTDIHIHLEVYRENHWIYKPCTYLLKERDYTFFKLLVGNVRSQYDESASFTLNNEPKGLPPDISDTVRYEIIDWGEDAHSISYFTLQELLSSVQKVEKSDINEHSKILFHRLIDCMLDFINEQITPSDIRIIFWFDC